MRVAKQDNATIQNKFGNSSFEFSKKSMQQINYLNGIPQKLNFKSALNFGFENRIVVLEIETIK
jgi:hypothetical protein